MVAGGVLASLVLTPTIALFGQGTTAPIFPGTKPIAAMTAKDIRDAYILYIGAGAVAAGGIISLLQALPLILVVDPVGPGRPGAVGRRGRAVDGPDRARPAALARRASARRRLVAAIAATDLFPPRSTRPAGSSGP